MSDLNRYLKRLFTVPYTPRPEERPFLDRAETQRDGDLEITVAALSPPESARFFGVRMARRGMQPVWVRVVNGSQQAVRLDQFRIDAGYYTPLEAAWVNHFAIAKRLLSFGILAWLFLPLLPLVPFKLWSARGANRRIDAFFKRHGFRTGPIRGGDSREGFVFTAADEGTKNVDVALIATDRIHPFTFSLEVPGLALGDVEADAQEAAAPEAIDRAALRTWLEKQPRATTNQSGSLEGDPLNLVVIGSRAEVRMCFGARWDETETINLETCWKTARAFLFDAQYRYSPVSPLYHAGRSQDLALQKARASINERIHLRLWRTDLALEGQPVWVGQVSRDIGVRFTLKTWNLTTHKIDPDVDEARDYVIEGLLSAGRVAEAGFVAGVEAAPPDAPRHNLTGDPYFTDGLRTVVILSPTTTRATYLPWA